jgi:hypothetical protein
MYNCGHDLPDANLLLLGEPHLLKIRVDFGVFAGIVAIGLIGAALVNVRIRCHGLVQVEGLQQLGTRPFEQIVKGMVVPLAWRLRADPALLKQVG